jgi:hypothetical protein
VKDRTEYGIGTEGKSFEWDSIPWDFIENSIRKLRQRIFRDKKTEKQLKEKLAKIDAKYGPTFKRLADR